MYLERIKERIDGDIQGLRKVYESAKGFTEKEVRLMDDMEEVTKKTRKALKIYKELIIKIHSIVNDDMPSRAMRIEDCIPELEEKYYPPPKPKTTKEKLTAFINKQIIDTPLITGQILKELEEIRDEMGE